MNNFKHMVSAIMCGVLLIFAGCASDAQSQTSASYISDDEIKELYRRAFEAFAWFDMTTMPVYESDRIEVDGRFYWRVAHDEISTLEELELYLNAIFADDIVLNSLLSMGRHRDIDGVLFAHGGDRPGFSMVGGEVHEIIRLSETEIIYRVMVDIYDGVARSGEANFLYVLSHDFYLGYKDGLWRFSNFHMVR